MNRIPTLHILNKAPGHPRQALCLSAMAPDDVLLLIENGVLGSAAASPQVGRCYAIAADLNARALDIPAEGVEAISYDDMVALTAAADKVISW